MCVRAVFSTPGICVLQLLCVCMFFSVIVIEFGRNVRLCWHVNSGANVHIRGFRNTRTRNVLVRTKAYSCALNVLFVMGLGRSLCSLLCIFETVCNCQFKLIGVCVCYRRQCVQFKV